MASQMGRSADIDLVGAFETRKTRVIAAHLSRAIADDPRECVGPKL